EVRARRDLVVLVAAATGRHAARLRLFDRRVPRAAARDRGAHSRDLRARRQHHPVRDPAARGNPVDHGGHHRRVRGPDLRRGLGGQGATLDGGGGYLLERDYHHLFTSDRHIAELYRELGMDDEIEWRDSSVAIYSEGRTYSFTTPLDLLRFRPLSIRARLRMG